MDSHQWRDRQQSDHQPSSGLTKLHLADQQQPHASALSLFAPEPCSNISKATIANPSLSPFPRIGYFTLAQWQELELQALIYKYMLAGVSVPLELILPIKRSLLTASPYYHHPELYQHLHSSMLQTGYWGRSVVDPEPGRCRRTDGKKWRCAREVVVGQKYCERHVHRGRNRSRKHVEIPTPSSVNGLKTAHSSPSGLSQDNHFNLPGSLPTLGILPNQRQPDTETVEKSLQSNCSSFYLQEVQDHKSEGYVLQRFLDEWPKSQQETNSSMNYNHPSSTTHLSISIPGNHPSDFSLKLSTGNFDKARLQNNSDNDDGRMVQPGNNWSGWAHHGEASMGGPLAEALRSSTSTHSPTSVLHKTNGSVSETSSISP
ncbi:growth-regulating factor 3 [Canna indica]|uniref:Growth-regulating factor n=1 Tax=Canna indica TaxID=4628 RepID=A0AAQ3K7X7_9LILI|nr:growth-regulating factor 3 [Canna indica]